MRKRQIAILCAWFLGINLFCTQIANAQKVSSPTSQQNYTPEQVLPQLAEANVIYLGETHDSPEDHKVQLEIIQQLYRKNGKIAIAMEMFQRPYQSVLDRYLAGKITEQELQEQSQFKERWGFPWEYYAPILRYAKENRLPVLALNTPSEVTRKVARQGLESLTSDERQHIPPFSEIRTDNAEYRQMLLDVFQGHQKDGHGSSAVFDKFFLAQVLWDETMAEKIAQFVKDNPDYLVVVLAGQGHIIYGYGIPSRVARRLGNINLVQRSLLLNPSPDMRSPSNKPIADFFWETSPSE